MDFITYQIKNSYLLFAFLIGILQCIVTRQGRGAAETIVSIFLVMLCTIPVFAIKGIGAADVKLFAVIACFFPPTEILCCMICALFLAGSEGILILIFKFLKSKNFSNSNITHIHFSLPMALSVLLQIGGFY